MFLKSADFYTFGILENSFLQSANESSLDVSIHLFGIGGLQFIVGNDILDNALAAGAFLFLQSGNSSACHNLIRWVRSRGFRFGSFLGLGSSGGARMSIHERLSQPRHAAHGSHHSLDGPSTLSPRRHSQPRHHRGEALSLAKAEGAASTANATRLEAELHRLWASAAETAVEQLAMQRAGSAAGCRLSTLSAKRIIEEDRGWIS